MAASAAHRAYYHGLRWIATLATLVLVGFLVHRALFLMHAEHTQGRVVAIMPANDRCKEEWNATPPCGRLAAVVEIEIAAGKTSRFPVEAAQRRIDEPDRSLSRYQVGEIVPVVYDPSFPQRAYVADLRNFWKMPAVLLIGAMFAWFAAWLWPKPEPPPPAPPEPAVDAPWEEPPVGREMVRGLGGWIGARLAELLVLALVFGFVAYQSDSLDFRDYFGEARAIGWTVVFGWDSRTIFSSDDADWRVPGAHLLAPLIIVVALVAAILEMPSIALLAFPVLFLVFALRKTIYDRIAGN